MTRLVFLAFLIVSTGLPSFSFDGYSLVRNTTSHLGAQGSPFAWVMNVTFIALGVTAVLVSWKTRVTYHQVLGTCFGVSLVLTGVFHHAPLVDGIPVNLSHDQLHSVFASTTGLFFTLLATGHGFMNAGRHRVVGFYVGRARNRPLARYVRRAGLYGAVAADHVHLLVLVAVLLYEAGRELAATGEVKFRQKSVKVVCGP
ncbi:DUF998 domain-containing protein [Exiguobacterium sp.]|uniref:DUF998 domain-containing protein n=1 Tax=Exiguobacterium sp. TaxID=44751 RepID=UPI002A01C06F|nr:DUF998 domain-containing protein [Exiguobacterium sp.]